MLHSIQVRVHSADNLATRVAEIGEWLDSHRHSMAADHVLVRVDFKAANEAAAFSEAFGGTLHSV